MKKTIILFLILAFIVSGCGLYSSKPASPDKKIEVSVSDIDSQITAALKDATKDDCVRIYTIFSGLAEFTSHTSKFKKTPDVLKAIAEVEKDYGWEKGKYKDLTTAINIDLTGKGYADPKNFDDELRDKTVKVFKGYAESIKKSILSKQ